jgi:hypothetical protein
MMLIGLLLHAGLSTDQVMLKQLIHLETVSGPTGNVWIGHIEEINIQQVW